MGAGVIDSCYRGLVAVVFFNVSNRVFEMNKGRRFAQIIFQKIDAPHSGRYLHLMIQLNVVKARLVRIV